MDGRLDVEALELVHHALAALAEGLEIRRGPPVVQPPGGVELRPLIVETMADLVADHDADGAIVDGVGSLEIEGRRLEDARRKDDLVEQRVVVRIGGGRSHAPAPSIRGLPDGRAEVVDDELPALQHVLPDWRITADAHPRIVLPLVRISDLRVEGGELLQRPPFRLRPHPAQALDDVLHRRELVAHQLLHPALGRGRKVALDVFASQRLPEPEVRGFGAPLPARLQLGHASEVLLIERERLLDESLREPRRGRSEQLPAQIGAPGRQRRLRQLLLELGKESRLLHVQLSLRQFRLVVQRRPVEVRGHGAELLERGRMIEVVRIAERDVVQRGFRQPFLEGEDDVRGFLRSGRPRQLEHALHVQTVLLARVREARLRLQIVVAIGQAKPGRSNVRGRPRRVVLVGLRAEREGREDQRGLQVADRALQIRLRPDSVDLRKHRGQGGNPRCFRARLVHAGGVIVADDLLDASAGPVGPPGDLLEDVLETLLVLLARLPAAAPALHRGRNRIRLAPGPIGELEEVRTGVGAAVDVRELHAVLLRRRWRRRTLLASAGGRGRREQRNAGRTHCPNTLLAAEDFNTRTAGAAVDCSESAV